MKWILLLAASAAVVPLAMWLRQNPREVPKLWTFVGFLVVEHGPLHTYMSLDSWAGQWPGYTFGAEISLLDLICIAIYLTLPRSRHSLPFLFSIGLYFFAASLSVFQASVQTPSVFYVWQLARVFFFYTVVTKACAADERVVPALLKGIAFGMFLAAGQAIWERFGSGVLQTAGGFPHRNFLGMVSHFVVYPFFALLLAGERGWLPLTMSFAGAIVAILTTSRATVGLAGLGYFAVFLVSALRGWTPRKSTVAGATLVAVVALSPLFYSSFEQRFGATADVQTSFFEPDETRVMMENAAHIMLANHPMGVGANQYVYAANAMGYNQASGLSWANYGAFVHDAYLLVAAETGYFGLAAFVIMLLRPVLVAFRCAWRNRRDKRGDLLIGLGVGLLTVYAHNFFEWIFVTFQCEYLFAANVAMIAGLAQQLGYWKHVRARRVSSAPSKTIEQPAAARTFRLSPRR